MNLFGQINDTISIKGTSDSLVVVPINVIRQATIKLVERQELKAIVAQQDTIITEQKQLVSVYKNYNLVLADENIALKNSCEEYERINKDLAKRLERSKNCFWILGGVAVSAVAVTAITLLCGK